MKLYSPAKINLFLEVTGKRSDGYHTLSSLMCCISLYDILWLRPQDNGFCITCNMPGIPEDDSNLALKAAKLFFRRSGIGGGVSIVLEKKIPAGAGLGGGSSNAATVLTGLNTYFNTPFNGSDLVEMAVELGADVPFFIYGKPAIAEGIGEKLNFCENIVPYSVIVIYPAKQLSTAEVYKKLNFGLTKSEKKIKSRLLNKGFIDPVDYLCNDLEDPAFSICEEIHDVKHLLESHNADGVLMSGSGSSVFGLYSHYDTAKMTYDILQNQQQQQKALAGWEFFLVDLIL